MAKQIKLTEEELRNLIASKIQEALEHNVDLEYSPAIGNKKRGPGKDSMDQMSKRKNKKMDEGVDEAPIYRRLPDGDLDYDGEDGESNSGTKAIPLSNEAYVWAFKETYGRVPGDIDDIIEEWGLPDEICVRFTLKITSDDGDYYNPPYSNADIEDWEIEDESFDDFGYSVQDIIKKAAEYEMDAMSGNELTEYLDESKIRRVVKRGVSKLVSEATRKNRVRVRLLKESKLFRDFLDDMQKSPTLYDFLRVAEEKYGVSKEDFDRCGYYELWSQMKHEPYDFPDEPDPVN